MYVTVIAANNISTGVQYRMYDFTKLSVLTGQWTFFTYIGRIGLQAAIQTTAIRPIAAVPTASILTHICGHHNHMQNIRGITDMNILTIFTNRAAEPVLTYMSIIQPLFTLCIFCCV